MKEIYLYVNINILEVELENNDATIELLNILNNKDINILAKEYGGFEKVECLSHELAFKLTGKIFKEKWKVRKEKLCHCVQMVDIGDYNCCNYTCKYCNANYDEKKELNNIENNI